jgi:hypothetical protein
MPALISSPCLWSKSTALHLRKRDRRWIQSNMLDFHAIQAEDIAHDFLELALEVREENTSFYSRKSPIGKKGLIDEKGKEWASLCPRIFRKRN